MRVQPEAINAEDFLKLLMKQAGKSAVCRLYPTPAGSCGRQILEIDRAGIRCQPQSAAIYDSSGKNDSAVYIPLDSNLKEILLTPELFGMIRITLTYAEMYRQLEFRRLSSAP